MIQINQNRGHIIVESVNVSCFITSIPNQVSSIMAMEQISIIFANTYAQSHYIEVAQGGVSSRAIHN